LHQLVRAFFERFERANLSSDVATIGSLYADTFLFGGPSGVQAVKKEDFPSVGGSTLQAASRGVFAVSQLEGEIGGRRKIRHPVANASDMTIQSSSVPSVNSNLRVFL